MLLSRVSWAGLIIIWCSACCGLGMSEARADHEELNDGWLVKVAHTPQQPRSGEPVRITAEVSGVTEVSLQVQIVEPGAYLERKDPAYATRWTSLPMALARRAHQSVVFSAELPAEIQRHRRLIRYRLRAADAAGRPLAAPDPAAEGNFAYFVYDGIPAWTAAINPKSADPKMREPTTFPSETMRSVQAYHLIARRQAIEDTTWNEKSMDKVYRHTGTLVVDGEVFDHIRYRARGGEWRYALGKNMWKFDLGKAHRLTARDDFGRPLPASWTKVDLRACIQHGDFGFRGEQGMFETVGFRLFNLVGVPAPFTHWIQLRVIDEAEESPADQYRGDFWGLYLAIENEDGRFLKGHGLPDGNLYKMDEGGGAELKHHGAGAVTNRSDLEQFVGTYSKGDPDEAWWRANLDLPGYYSYRAVCECIHHYDLNDGKNYDYFHDPETGQWRVFPWDIDMTWSDGMYGTGDEPFKRRVLAKPAFQIEYQNRLREIRDLLFNPEQTGQLIREYARVIGGSEMAMVEADRRKWDYHPMMAHGPKAGQGLFYQAALTKDFAGMVARMKAYVRSRGVWIDEQLLADPTTPPTPAAVYRGESGFPPSRLRFGATFTASTNVFSALKWRLAEITPVGSTVTPRRYEITPVWESPELRSATAAVTIPAGVATLGHTYRARARIKDPTGRWSHWSAPVEFVAGK